ncbi:MAG: hypothetical protein NTX86_00380 [Candidatus Dependentiae bacterium]|nr:hypothetical protein [Candidatus Dependentiae bacterium]
MYFNFERYEFLEFFDTEKILDEEIGSVRYTIRLEHDFSFEIYVLAIDKYMSITLYHSKLSHVIFNIGFHEIDKIRLEKTPNATFLVLYKEDPEKFPYHDETTREPYLKIMIKPSVAIQLSL